MSRRKSLKTWSEYELELQFMNDHCYFKNNSFYIVVELLCYSYVMRMHVGLGLRQWCEIQPVPRTQIGV